MISFNADEIISLCNIRPFKVNNIFLYGSRVYGTAHSDSDYDLLVVGGNLLERQELHKGKFNIHIIIPTKFEENLRGHDVHMLECIWAPDFAIILNKRNFLKEFTLDKKKLKKKLLSQSHQSWMNGKRKIIETDLHRGSKSIWHSIRILQFGIQIVKHGRINDFQEANKLYTEIVDADEYRWNYYRDKYLPYKKELEDIFIKM